MTTALDAPPPATPADESGRGPGPVWIPVGLIGVYYGLPVLLALPRPDAALVVGTGILGCGAAVLRHRRPRSAMVVAVACLLVSPIALGGVVGIIASRARHLRGRRELPGLVAWVAAAVVVKAVQLAFPVDGGRWSPVSTVEMTISVSMIGFALLAGLLGRSLAHSSAAERTAQQARAAEIRLEERARIAREMHDVVAHRISLVAMTSGALAYRDDLPPDAHEAAAIIQSNARQALTELRGLLSDLRGEGTGPGGPASAFPAPEAPQPTLEHLPVLLADAREVTDIRATCDIDLGQVAPSVGRQLYRIVQEALTNARKHAPGQPVSVRIDRSGADLVVQVRNPINDGPVDESGVEFGTGGYGLIGIQERAHLLGGRAQVDIVDGRFQLTVRVPERLTP